MGAELAMQDCFHTFPPSAHIPLPHFPTQPLTTQFTSQRITQVPLSPSQLQLHPTCFDSFFRNRLPSLIHSRPSLTSSGSPSSHPMGHPPLPPLLRSPTATSPAHHCGPGGSALSELYLHGVRLKQPLPLTLIQVWE